MSEIGSITNNPILGYRLDPYEPGLLRQSRASQSTSQVVAHEYRNLTRLSRQAVLEGRVIISKTITFRPVIAGSYMGTAAGKTTVVSVEKYTPQTNALSQKPEQNDKNSPVSLHEDFNKEASIYPQSQLAQESLEDLNQEEWDIRTEIRQMNSEIDEFEREKAHSHDKHPIIEPGKSSGQLKQKLDEKKEELRKVYLSKIMKSQEKLLGSLSEGMLDANKTAFNIVDAIYKGQDKSDDFSGLNIDLTV